MPDYENIAADFARLFLRIHRLMDQRMASHGASLARTKLLLFLRRDGPARAAEIAEFFGHAPRTVTEAIDALEREGLVQRSPDASDRRAKLVSVTEAGCRAIEASEPLRMALVEQLFGVLDADQIAQFEVILDRLSTSVGEQEQLSNKSRPVV